MAGPIGRANHVLKTFQHVELSSHIFKLKKFSTSRAFASCVMANVP